MAAGNLVQGALFTVMVVRAAMLRDSEFEHELARQIGRSPRFFQNAPVVLDLRGVENFTEAAEFETGQGQAARADPDHGRGAERAAGAARGRDRGGARRASRQTPAAQPRAGSRRAAARRAKGAARHPAGALGDADLCRGSDLIVIAPVSAGAELIADGNVHVYGALRGRALAGASGDARGAHLLHPARGRAGQHRRPLSRQRAIAAGARGAPVQMALVDDQLTITRN